MSHDATCRPRDIQRVDDRRHRHDRHPLQPARPGPRARSGRHRAPPGPGATERYILRHGDTLYRVQAASARAARDEVLAYLDDPAIWRGELEAWNEPLYRELYGEPDVVVDVPDVADDVAGEFADFEAGDDPTWREVEDDPAPEADGPPRDKGGRLPVADDWRTRR